MGFRVVSDVAAGGRRVYLSLGKSGMVGRGQAGSNYFGLLSVKALDRRFIVFLTRLSFLPLHHGADNMGTTGIRQASRQANGGNKEGRQAGKE